MQPASLSRTLRRLAGASALALIWSASAQATPRPVVEVAFVLDTTGSMSGLIEGAKRKIWSIATRVVEANPDAEVRMALVAYRDIGDDYVTRKFDLTDDIQGLYAELLKFRANGGGDWPESVNEALDIGIGKLSWSRGPDTTRILFLVGDAPPHMDYKQDRKYPEIVEAALRKGIVINAVQAGEARDTERVWRDIAQRGEGRYIPIPQDGGKVSVIETPYDREILDIRIEIDRTIIPYGRPEQQRSVSEKRAQKAAAPAPAASDMESYLLKKAGPRQVVTGAGDLVGDVAAGKAEVASIPEDELPAPMRGLDKAERQAYVARQSEARKALDERLKEAVARRDGFIRDAQAREATTGAKDSFDRAVEDTIREQVNAPRAKPKS